MLGIYNVLMPETPRVTLLLKNAKSSESGPEAMEQAMSAIPWTKRPMFGFMGPPEAIAFEIISYNQQIYFQVNAPEDQIHYMKSQLIAAYPEITVDDPLPELASLEPLFEKPHAYNYIKLAKGEYFSLKTYKDFSETDPMSAILSSLSKLAPGQSAIIQILVAGDSDKWKNGGYTKAAGKTDKEGKVTPHPEKDMIEDKLSRVCHRSIIKVATFADDINQANTIMTNLVGAFSTFTNARGNSLVTGKPTFGKLKLAKSIPFRNLEKTPKEHWSAQELASIFHMPNHNTKDIKNIVWGKTLLGEPPANLPTYAHTPEGERDQINLFAKTEYKNETQIFGIKDNDRRRHMYIIGKSGTGKSTLLGNMIVNDIKRGKGVAVIDPHGDLAEEMLHYIPSHRINDVIYLNPADPEYSVRLNLLEDTGMQFTELIASGIIAIFKKLYAHSWGPRLEHILRNTLLALIEKDQSTMEDIIKMLTNQKFREKTVEQLRDPVVKNFWAKEWVGMGQRMQGEAVAPILNKIGQFVSSPLIRNVINSPSSSFSIEGAMNEGKIMLCNLSQGKLGEDNATLMGAMLITKIQLAAMNRVYIPEEERRDFILYVDEFQNFATTSFIKILSEARKYRLSLVLANQYVEQIDEEIRFAIFGNCGSLITFLVGAGDASLLSQEFGAQYTPEDLVSIQNHQIVLKLMTNGTTSNPFPAWTLPPAASKNGNAEKVIQVSNERYAKKKVNYSERPDPHMNDNKEDKGNNNQNKKGGGKNKGNKGGNKQKGNNNQGKQNNKKDNKGGNNNPQNKHNSGGGKQPQNNQNQDKNAHQNNQGNQQNNTGNNQPPNAVNQNSTPPQNNPHPPQTQPQQNQQPQQPPQSQAQPPTSQPSHQSPTQHHQPHPNHHNQQPAHQPNNNHPPQQSGNHQGGNMNQPNQPHTPQQAPPADPNNAPAQPEPSPTPPVQAPQQAPQPSEGQPQQHTQPAAQPPQAQPPQPQAMHVPPPQQPNQQPQAHPPAGAPPQPNPQQPQPGQIPPPQGHQAPPNANPAQPPQPNAQPQPEKKKGFLSKLLGR